MGSGRGRSRRAQAAVAPRARKAAPKYSRGERVVSASALTGILPLFEQQPNLVILVGAPGSGKSYWGRKFAEAHGHSVVETDEIRYRLTGSYKDQSRNTEVFDLFYSEVQERLARGENVVADSTGITVGIRRHLRATAMEGDGGPVGVHLVLFDNHEQAERRNQRRRGDDRVGAEVWRRFKTGLERSKVSLLKNKEARHYDSLLFVEDSRGASTQGRLVVNSKRDDSLETVTLKNTLLAE